MYPDPSAMHPKQCFCVLTREKGSQITTCGDRVGGDVKEKLDIDESERDERKSSSGLGRRVDIQHSVHDVNNVPNLFTELRSRCRCNDDT